MRQNLLSSQILDKNFRLLVSLVTFLSIILFYFWTATSNFKPFYFVFEKEPHTYHQLIADGFLHGHLYLNIEPPKELLNLPNPYDPNLNVKYRLHDASLYHGKYYFYFTPLVAALFLIPFKLLTGYYLPDELLLSLFCSLGFIFSFLTLKKLLSFANIRLGLLNQIFSLLTLATATMVPFLMRRIAVYELCIGLGYCFLMMSLFCFLHCFDEKNKNLKKFLIVTGFLFGLTIWARPNQMIGIGGLVFSFLLINRFYFKKNIQTILIESSLMCLPVITVGLMMMLYNYLRFGSIFEFGVHYQLAGENQTKIPIMSIKNVLCSLLNYLFIKFSFYNIFPYFFLTTKPFLKSPFTYYHYEPVIGILSLPIFYFLGTFLFIKKLWVKSALFAYITFFIFISSLVSFIVVSFAPGVSMRYLVDFTPSLLITTLACFFGTYYFFLSKNHLIKTISLSIFYLCLVFSLIFNLHTSLTGYHDNLKIGNPKLYARIKNTSIKINETLISSFITLLPGKHYTYMLQNGFDSQESWGGVWSITNNPSLKIWITKSYLDKDMLISFDLVPYSPNNLEQNITININHKFFKNYIFNQRQLVNFKIPAKSLITQEIDVDFQIKNPKSPAKYSDSSDTRNLGVGLIGLKVKSL